MLSRLSGGLAVALATKSTLVLLKRFWEGLTDHASQGYDVRVFEDLGDGYGCAESIPNRDSWCLLSFGPQIQSIIQPLLDESVNIQKKMNPIKKYNYPLRADRLNVVWHVRT
eukprot:gene22863-29612_t